MASHKLQAVTLFPSLISYPGCPPSWWVPLILRVRQLSSKHHTISHPSIPLSTWASHSFSHLQKVHLWPNEALEEHIGTSHKNWRILLDRTLIWTFTVFVQVSIISRAHKGVMVGGLHWRKFSFCEKVAGILRSSGDREEEIGK